jgi:hypothetical protein
VSGRRTQYVLDTNIFIQAKNDYYAFDICPGFWTALKRHGDAASVISVDRVFDELQHGYDDLSDWVKAAGDDFFKQTADQQVLAEYTRLVAWANSQPQLARAAKDEFSQSDNADAWVVAYAKVNGCVVVTHETFEPDIKKKVKIPNACQAFNVRYVNTFDMLRALKTKFILSTKKQPSR